MCRLCRFSLPRDGFELLDLVLMLHAAHKALAVDRVAAVAGKAFAPVLRAAFELCGKVRLADERVQIERRLLPRTAVEVDAADLRSVHAAKANYGPEGRGFESLTAYQKSSKSSDFEDFCFS